MDLSYEYQNARRDLSDEIAVVAANEPALISVVEFGGMEATATKHEWAEDQMGAELVVLTAAAVIDATTFEVESAANLLPGIVLTNEGDEAIRISGVDTETNRITVLRGYGTTTPKAIPAGRKLRVVSRPRPEGTDPGDDPTNQPGTQWNQTEIFDTTAKVSRTAQAVAKYGIADALDYQVEHQMKVLARRMNNSTIYGIRVLRTKTDDGSMGGLLYFLGQPNAIRIPAGGAEVSLGLLNDTTEAIVARGGRPSVILCGTKQARKISAQNKEKIQVLREDRATGNVVYEVVSDLPMGITTRVVVEPNFPDSKIALLDPAKIRIAPLKDGALADKDATPAGADYFARRILGEYTMEFKNALESAALIEELA
ncbi:SU10 major capsid protein [Endothiovibrio diazotrophicus]